MKIGLKRVLLVAGFSVFLMGASGDGCNDSSDDVARKQQEVLLQQGNNQVGMPDIKNFTEKRLMKMILEKRDQAKLPTYTYLVAENSGQLVYFGQTFGYGLPYATQFTNPSKIESSSGSNYQVLPQADPNGLFSPASAEGTWILMSDPRNPSAEPEPIYIEPRIVVSPFPLK